MGEPKTPMKVAVIGAAVSANKGAASMVYGLVDGLTDADIAVDLSLLTTYKADDEAVLAALDGRPFAMDVPVRVIDASPASLLLAFVLALPIRLLDRFSIPLGPLLAHPLIRAVRRSDVTVDLAGIAFADGRGIALLGYNVVMSLFPYLAGGTVVKASQALGPFDGRLTRMAARIVLPRMAVICARGASTRRHLDGLGLTNVVDAADIAFLMRHVELPDDVLSVFPPPGTDAAPVVAVLPSSVVDAYAASAGIDHVGTIATMIDELSERAVSIVVAPHSFRRSGERGRMNDGPIVEDVEHRVTGSAVFINRDLDPRELRAIIERSDVAVTGRFHAMVSALEVGTPPVVIGWSHKYGEVLDQFDVGSQGIAVADLSAERLIAMVTDTLENSVTMAETISASHDEVGASARRNIEVIVEAATGQSPHL